MVIKGSALAMRRNIQTVSNQNATAQSTVNQVKLTAPTMPVIKLNNAESITGSLSPPRTNSGRCKL